MILVTGGTGHVGNVLIRTLLARGEEVRALVLPDDPCVSLDGLDVTRVEGNVLDPASLRRAMTEVAVVYHLAGIISILPGREALMQRVNVEGAGNVAQAALASGVRRMVHVSSIHAFRRAPHGITVDETHPFATDRPAGSYDRTKAEGMLRVLAAVEQGLDAVIVCPTGIIGPHDYLGSEMGQVVAGYARRRVHFLVEGAYDFVDVRDVAQGLILAGERGRTGEAYILTGTHVTLPEIKALTQEIVGVHSSHIVVPLSLAKWAARFTEFFYRLTHTTPQFTTYSLETVEDNAIFSCAKAEAALGYRSRPLRETLRDLLRWQRAQATA